MKSRLAEPGMDCFLTGPDGRVLELFHATDATFTEFRPFSHFGTRAAAEQIGGKRLLVVRLRALRTLLIPDLDDDVRNSNHSVLRLVDQLHYDLKVLTATERDRVFRAANGFRLPEDGAGALAKILCAKGYDSLAYENLFEDSGEHSFVVFYPWQVEIVREEPKSGSSTPALPS